MSEVKKPAIEVPKRIVEGSHTSISRQFVFSKLISTNTREEKFYTPMDDPKVPYHRGIGDIGAELINGLINLPGVKEVSITPYEIDILKCTAVEWAVIIDVIRETLLQVVFGGNEGVEVNQIEVEG